MVGTPEESRHAATVTAAQPLTTTIPAMVVTDTTAAARTGGVDGSPTALLIADPAGSSARWPSARAHAITAEIRCRTRFAVVGLVAHIGVRTAITSALVIRSTHFDPITGDT